MVDGRVATFLKACTLLLAAAPVSAQVSFPFRTEGVCPFECCQLGQWQAGSPIPVYRVDRDTHGPIATIPAGASFTADQGAYWSITPLVMRTRVETTLLTSGSFVLTAPDRGSIGRAVRPDLVPITIPADTRVHVLADLGEGEAVGLADGHAVRLDSDSYAPRWDLRNASPFEVIEPTQIPCEEVLDPASCPRTYYHTPHPSEWWVHIRFDGADGWIDAGTARVTGSKGCG